MKDLEKQLYLEIVNLYKKTEKETSYKPSRVLQMINSGAKPSEVIKRIINIEGGNLEFEILKSKNRLDLSVENVVLHKKYENLFSDREKEWCRIKLQKCGYDFKV